MASGIQWHGRIKEQDWWLCSCVTDSCQARRIKSGYNKYLMQSGQQLKDKTLAHRMAGDLTI
jgi:hypothetical protein